MDINRRNFIKAATGALLQLDLMQRGLFANNVNIIQDASSTTKSLKAVQSGAGGLRQMLESFSVPPLSDKPGGYWWWFNTLMNKEGITRDLSEFRKKGIGEVLLVNSAANLKNDPMPSGPQFLSEAWFDLYRFALKEAHRLEITVGVNLCAGWCMGGPWIKPEESGRWYLQAEKRVSGPLHFSDKLPLPGNHIGYTDVTNPPGIKQYLDLPLEQLDYRDTAVIAVPLPDSGNYKLAGDRRALVAAKANRMDASNFTAADVIMDKPLLPWQNLPEDAPIDVSRVVNLTDRLQPDGTLTWDVPDGEWVIIRTGSRMTGSRNLLGLPGGEGLSIDWLSRIGVDSQFKHLGLPLLEAAKPYVGNTLAYFCDDSFEDGFPNWTGDIIEQFKNYRGYDPTPYLGALSGFIIGSAEISDRFLYDYRKTVADLMADGHYRRFADLCHEQGIKVQNESAGPSRSGTMCMDGLKNLGRSDFPMGEFWLGQRYGEADEEDWTLGYGKTRLTRGQNKTIKMVASAAHLYGKNLVSAESFTATSRTPWGDAPSALRYAVDRAFCEGLNRVMIHTMTASRPEDGKPGYEYYAGTHFNPNVTWWNQSGAFLTYLARCQNLLRQGLFVADVLYYNGDWAPNLVPEKQLHAGLGKGYDYDVCNTEIILTRLTVKDGWILLPDGMSYRLLVLPDTKKMPLAVLTKLAELVNNGAVIIGPKPVMDPGLKGYPESDRQVKLLGEKLWGNCDGKTVTSHSYGKGQIFWGVTERQVLEKLAIPPDLKVAEDTAYFDFIHRRSNDADIYFILNRKKEKQQLTCTFRVENGLPHHFDPVSGKVRELPQFQADKNSTRVELKFEPRQSYFIVFPRAPEAVVAVGGQPKVNFPAYVPLKTLDGSWTVKFDPKWGGPTTIEFPALTDWTQNVDDGIRYYSGTATYLKTFEISTDAISSRTMLLDLGSVKNIADVRLNGTLLGTVWTNPWQVDISGVVHAGDNHLEIDVTNLWPNRLIKDAALPAQQRLTKTNIEFKATDPLLPSGLLGPVNILKIETMR